MIIGFRAALAVLAISLLTSCGAREAPAGPAVPEPSPSPTGSVPKDRLEAMLLQSSDLPGLGGRRVYADAGLITQGTPQLFLCRQPVPVGPHEIANVIASSSRPGGVKVFQVLSVFQDEAAAKAAYDVAVAAAKACASYDVGGLKHRVLGLSDVELGAGTNGVHYALVTSDVVSGDVRTLARRGSVVVLVSGFGEPPTKQPLRDYQLDLMAKALARLG